MERATRCLAGAGVGPSAAICICCAAHSLRAASAELVEVAVRDSRSSRREAAATALKEKLAQSQGNAAAVIGPLLQVPYQESRPEIRANAYRAMGIIGDPSAVGLLTHYLKTEEKAAVKQLIVEALGRIGPDAKAAAPLIELVAGSAGSAELRDSCARAVQSITR